MRRRSNNFWAARRATTLIEVIAGLVILGTILAALLIARGRFAQQEAMAQRKLAATRSLDALVSQWLNGPVGAIPVSARGDLGESNQTWRTHLIPDPSAESLGAHVMRVEVFDRNARQPILTLDLLLQAKESS